MVGRGGCVEQYACSANEDGSMGNDENLDPNACLPAPLVPYTRPVLPAPLRLVTLRHEMNFSRLDTEYAVADMDRQRQRE